MYFKVRHVTRFRYSARISESVMEVRMQPRNESGQHCLQFELTTNPPARVSASRDYLGNVVHHFSIPARHTQLLVTAQALVTTTLPPVVAPLDPGAWHELDQLVDDTDVTEMLVPSHFARPTEQLHALARELRVGRRDDPVTVLLDLNHALHAVLAYSPESTSVDSPIDDALRQRRGVCQDFAHIMPALVRELGIPCRYVSGYLYGHGHPGDPSGTSATHAWVEALLPRLGWIGFDPTNDTLVGERHIRTAIGRDYADVPPARGVFKGQVVTELGVAVQVVPAEQTFAEDEFLILKQPAPPIDDGEQPEQQQQALTRCLPGTCAAVQNGLFHES